MNSWFVAFETCLEQYYGYTFVVHFEDTILFLAGVFIGVLVMAVLCGRVLFKLQKVNDLGTNKIKLIQFRHGGNSHYITDPHSLAESIETLLIVIFSPLFRYKDYTHRDETRTKIFLLIMAVLGALILMLAVISISNITTNNRLH